MDTPWRDLAATPRLRLVETGARRRYAVAELAAARPDGDSFNVLAGYLFGKNAEDRSMAMTMPVEMNDGKMAFVLPKVDADAPPTPSDDAVSVTTRPPRRVIALEFPGVSTPEEVERQRAKLATIIAEEGLEADDGYTVLQYNAPYTVPWRRRNEIVVALVGDAPPVAVTPAAAAPSKPATAPPAATTSAAAPSARGDTDSYLASLSG